MRSLLRLGSLLLVFSALTPARAQDAADFVVRLNRLEGQVRQMSGQVEQLQHENRQLKEQLRRFQEDVEFRFQERGGQRPAQTSSTSTPGSGAASAPRAPARRGDAFDPASQPNAAGAPRPLGAPLPDAAGGGRGAPATALDDDTPGGSGPLDLGELGRLAAGQAPSQPAQAAPPSAPGQRPFGVNPGGFGSASNAAPAAGGTRAEYDAAYASLQQKQYEQAETAFRAFLQAHPRDRLVPEATFWLGESFLQRGRHREAAEQFLKVSTDHARSAKAPDAMLKLGIALNAMGARDQACATFAELERKFPQAGAAVKQGVDREQKRARCPT